jgi:hypothetical protein
MLRRQMSFMERIHLMNALGQRGCSGPNMNADSLPEQRALIARVTCCRKHP